MYDEVISLEFPLYLGIINLDVTFRLVGQNTKDRDSWELRKINHWVDGDDLTDLLIYAETHKAVDEIKEKALDRLIESFQDKRVEKELDVEKV